MPSRSLGRPRLRCGGARASAARRRLRRHRPRPSVVPVTSSPYSWFPEVSSSSTSSPWSTDSASATRSPIGWGSSAGRMPATRSTPATDPAPSDTEPPSGTEPHPASSRRSSRAGPRPGDLLADHLGRSTRSHGHAVQGVGRFHGPLLVAHDDQLGLAPELVHQPEKPLQVDVVEGRLDFVHQVEGGGTAAEHGEQEGQRHQGALAAGEQRQAPDVATGRAHLHLDAGVEEVFRIGEGEPARAPGEQRGHQGGEVLVHVGEGGVEHVHDLFVEGPDHVVQFAAGRRARPPPGPRGTGGAR